MRNAYNGLDILHEANMMPIFAIDNLFNLFNSFVVLFKY